MSRRLLLRSGSGSFVVPATSSSFTLTTATKGSWSNVDPRAFYYNGATYFTWADGTTGDTGVSKYVHATGVTTSTVIAAAFAADDHATPSVIVRASDHKVVVAWSAHDGATVRRWISTSAEDISAGSTASGGASDYTYMTLVQTGTPIYWFFREVIGGQGYLKYVKSTDGLATWASPVSLLTTSGHVPYWRIASDWTRYIHVFTTNVEPNTSGSFLYHFYIDTTDDSLHKSDGTTISASLPLSASNLTLVTDGIASGGYCLALGGCVDGSGKPAVAVRVGISSQTDNSIRVARWTGSAWQVNEVYTTGGTFPGFVYTPGATIHKTNPDIVYGARKVSGHYRISKFVSPDSGTTWGETTLGSTDESFYPESVVNPATELEAIWPSGTFTSDTSYAFGMQGYGSGSSDVVEPGPGDWFGITDPWAGRPTFGTYTEAVGAANSPGDPWWISGDQSGAVIEQLTFSSRAAGHNVIVLDNVSNLTIRDIDFDTVPECIYINGGGSGLVIERIRVRNLFGPYTRTGFHSGNLVQALNPGPMKLRDLKVVQPDPQPGGYTAWGTEDIISLGGNTTWGGTAMTDADALIVERFAFDGGDWQSPSGTGSFIGDGDLAGGSGQYVWFRDGILLNPAQCAIGTGEQGPYRFERIDAYADHGGENAAFQVRSANVAIGDCRTDWTTVGINGGAPAYTDLGGNNFSASFTRPVITL